MTIQALNFWVGPITFLLLLGIAIIAAAGWLVAAVANGLSLLTILFAVAWVVRGTETIRRLSELYLWLAFILSVNQLQVLAQSLASWMGMEEHRVFQWLSVVHVAVVFAALWGYGAWSRLVKAEGPRMVARPAAGILILGAVVFWVGARTFPGMTLAAVAERLSGHMWTSANFLMATLITLVGLFFLTSALRLAGDRHFSILGLGAYLFGAVFWVLHLVFRLTVMPVAADEYLRTTSPPSWYQAWVDWNGMLFGIYSVLAYLGIVAYGRAFLKTALVPRWVGWFCMVTGLLLAPLFGPPLLIHAVLWFVSLLILKKPYDKDS